MTEPNISVRDLAIEFIKNHESLASSVPNKLSYFKIPKMAKDSDLVYAYRDSGGLPTIGWGSIKMPSGRSVLMSDWITKKQADELFLSEFNEKWDWLISNNHQQLTDNQLIALVDFEYNKGTPALANSTLWSMLQSGADVDTVALQFHRWVYDNGSVVKGLVNRANDEASIFLS